MNEFIEIIQVKFPIKVEIEETPLNLFDKNGALFKRDSDNSYCFIEPTERKQIFITLFHSDWIPFEKIENNYIDTRMFFSFTEPSSLKILIEALA